MMYDDERPQVRRTDETMKHMPIWSDLPPAQAGLAAALRRAFRMQADDNARKFDELLQKLC